MTMQRGLLILLAAVFAVVVASLMALYSLRAPMRTDEKTQANLQSWQVTLCFPNLKESRLEKVTVTIGASSLERVVSELFERLKSPDSPDLSPAVPPNARLLSVKQEGNTLTLDVSSEFCQADFWQGSDVAHLRLQALVHTLSSLPDIRSVRILVNGQVPEALGGHEELSEPIEPDPTL